VTLLVNAHCDFLIYGCRATGIVRGSGSISGALRLAPSNALDMRSDFIRAPSDGLGGDENASREGARSLKAREMRA
jgi:hypothetical protein